MTTTGYIRLDGLEGFLEDIQRMGLSVDQARDQALIAGGEVALDGMKRRVAVDTRNLQSHITLSAVKKDGNYGFVEVGVIRPDAKLAKQAVAQEYGTSKMAAHPFVRPTMAEDKAKIRAAMRNVLKGVLSGK